MVENTQQTLDMGRHNPRLQSEQWNGLYDGNVETPWRRSVRALPPQDRIKPKSALSGLLGARYYGRPVVFSRGQEVPQVLKGGHCFKWTVISP